MKSRGIHDWNDVLELPKGFSARFLWDRFLPDNGRYRWREYSSVKPSGPGERARVARLLGDPDAAVLLSKRRSSLEGKAWYAEAISVSQPSKAAAELARVLKRDRRPAWRAWRAAALASLGDLQGADAELARALADDPSLAAARALRAMILIRLERNEEALSELDQAIARKPAPGLFSMRAELRWLAGRRDEAVADAHAAVDAHPESLDGFVRLLYARRGAKAAAERAGERELLIEEARRAADDPKDAAWASAALAGLLGSGDLQLAPLRAALAREPGRAWVRAFLGRALGDVRAPGNRDGNLAAAEAELTAAANLAPKAGWILCWRAEVLKQLGRRDEALADLDAGLALDPDYKLGNAWRAELRAKAGDYKGAVADVEDCWKTLRRPSFLYRLSQVKRERGDAAGALADLAECVRLSPPHSLAFSPLPWLGDAKRLAHEGPAAASARAAFALRGKLRGLPAGQAWRGLRSAPCFIPSPPPPWRPDAKTLDAAKKSAAAEGFRGRALLDDGREKEALAALDRAARKAPELHAARLWRGEALLRLGRAKPALKDLSAAVATAPRSAHARLWRGLALWRLGQAKAAAEDWAEAARLDPPNARLAGWWLRALGVPPSVRRLAKGAREPLAELDLRLGAPVRALAALAGAKGARASLLRGAAEAALHRPEPAFAAWRAAAEDPVLLTSSLPGLLDGLPPLGAEASAAAHLALADAWAKLNRWEDRAGALSVARGLLAARDLPAFARTSFEPPSPRAGKGASPSERWALAEAAARDGRVQESLAAARSALRDDPGAADAARFGDAAWALAAAGAAARARGRLDEAAAAFDAALRREPLFSPARLWRGELRLTRGDFAGALSDLDAAGAPSLRDAEARLWRGRALCGLGRCEEAQRELALSARLDPRSAWAPLAAGVCHERRGDAAAAAPLLRRARRLAPALFAGQKKS